MALARDRLCDINGVLTGSATIVNGIPVIIYDGINENNEQIIYQARPATMPDLTSTEWIKSPLNPIITSSFGRDPSPGFQDDQKNSYLIYGFGNTEQGGQAILFTSKDFVHLTYLHSIHSNPDDIFWECPDLFNVSARVFMKASLCVHDFWTVGEFDPINKTFSSLTLDFVLSVLSSVDDSQRTNIGVQTRANSGFMVNCDVPGWDYFSVANMSDPYDCSRACDNDGKCYAWNSVKIRQVNDNCFLKTGIRHLEVDFTCISGVNQPR